MLVVRVVVMTVLHAAGHVAVASARATGPDSVPTTRALVLGGLVAAALLGGALDGWFGSRRPALAWFVTGLVAGPLAAMLGVFGQGLLVDATGLEELRSTLLGGAPFIALLIMVPAVLGIPVGRQLQGRERPASQRNASG